MAMPKLNHEMDFVIALRFCKETGKSIVLERYSDSAKKSVQYYFDEEGRFVCQNDDCMPKVHTIRGDSHFVDSWIPYPGKYEKFYLAQAKEREEFEELKNEVEPLYKRFRRYEELKRKLDM